jgi:tRNA modification GTPase
MSQALISGETIAAIATAIVPQQGSVGIVRLSGDLALPIAQTLFYAPGKQVWESHRLLYGYVRHPETQKTVDEALLLIMRSPRSYTREDVVEFHCHGGIVPVQQVLQLCIERGARLALPGEFTLRAFLNGRLDLTQAQSVADLVGARSEAASQIALAGLQGKLKEPIYRFRGVAVDILAEIEARIDFEDDLPPLDIDGVKRQIADLLSQVAQILATAPLGELLRSGLKVAIVGRPNVGKSSLLNAWSQTDRAIVTDLPGTTRDVVESQLVVRGIPIQVLDTAGIRKTADVVEKIGVKRSQQVAEAADLLILAIDVRDGWTDEDAEIYETVREKPLILAINKIDLAPNPRVSYPKSITQVVEISAAFNLGINKLEQAIVGAVAGNSLSAANLDLAIDRRQAAALTRAKKALEQVQATITAQLPLDFWTIDLREAIQALGEITGEEVSESVLDQIFSRFCIGK